MKKLAKVLQTELSGDLATLAQLIQSKGRGRDTILAHITPQEAEMLKERGGRGSINPDTGLLEFEPGYELEGVTITGDGGGGAASFDGYGGGVAGKVASQKKRKPSAPIDEGTDLGTTGPSSMSYPLTQTQIYSQMPAVPSSQITAAPTPGAAGPQTTPSMPYQPGPANVPDELTEVTPTARTGTKGIEAPKTLKEKAAAVPGQLWEGIGGAGGLGNLALLAFLGRQGRTAAEESRKESKEAANDLKTMAVPYQIYGQQLMSQAARGEMSPQSLRSYEAAQARLNQAAEERGGVGVMQASVQLEELRNQLLNNQYTYGIQVAQYGDQLASNAIATGLKGDLYSNQMTSDFYGNLMANIGNPFYTDERRRG